MGALDGIKVVEAGLLIQGPQASALLAEWGADVIKVEMPNFGDQGRWIFMAADDGRSPYFIAANRGKRSVTVDMRTPAGREVFLRLTDRADAVITNFTPGTMERWGLGYAEVSARNPRIIYASASTFGTAGPDAAREGADLSGQSSGGLVSTIGRTGGEPSPVGAAIADVIGAQNLAAGILAALYAREHTGRGQEISSSLLGSVIWAQASEITRCIYKGEPAGPANRGHPLIAGLYGIFPTADGWIAIVGVVGQMRNTFYETIGRQDLAERFPQLMYWEAEKEALFPLLDDTFRTRTTEEWSKILGDAGIRYARVNDHNAVVADEGVRANGYITEVDGPAGRETVVCAPVHFSDTPARPLAFAPELGMHTEEVLLEVGYDWDEITALRDAGAI